MVSFNVYAGLKNLKIRRGSFPLVVRFSFGEHAPKVVCFTDYIGKGDTTLYLDLDSAGSSGILRLSVSGGLPSCLTGQRLFLALLDEAAGAAGPPDTFQMELLERKVVRDGAEFGFDQNAEVTHTMTLSTVVRLGVRLKATREKKKDLDEKPALPFGLSFGPTELDMSGFTEHCAESSHVTKSDGESDSDEEPFEEQVGAKAVETASKEDVSVNMAVVPGRKLGICGFDMTPSDRSRCIVCLHAGLPDTVAKIEKDSHRFFCRLKVNKPDRSVHSACVLSGGTLTLSETTKKKFLEGSAAWLRNAVASEVQQDRQLLFLNAADVFAAALSGPSSSSASGHAGPPASAHRPWRARGATASRAEFRARPADPQSQVC